MAYCAWSWTVLRSATSILRKYPASISATFWACKFLFQQNPSCCILAGGVFLSNFLDVLCVTYTKDIHTCFKYLSLSKFFVTSEGKSGIIVPNEICPCNGRGIVRFCRPLLRCGAPVFIKKRFETGKHRAVDGISWTIVLDKKEGSSL